MADIKFVNDIGTYGFLNGVANISFVTMRHTPVHNPEAKSVDVNTTNDVSADLRMDLYCVQQLRDICEKILAENTKPAVTN